MSQVNNISNIDQKNGYTIKSGKSGSTGSTDFSSYLTETKSLDDIFDEAAKKYNVPVDLLKAIGKAESDFDADAVSRCGAQGIMQLMPSTAASLGVKDSFDPEQNIMGGAKYISGLLKKFDGDTKLALAAYNAGPNNVMKYGGIPPFEETQNYVVKVTNYMKQGVDTHNASVKVSSPVSVPKIGSYYYVTMPATPTPVESAADSIDDIFSELDYMKFLDLFFEDMNGEEKDNKDNTFGVTT
jgi:soluble lytic murein transglycosylase-like protein